jgi:hypothetical protein
MTLLGQVFQLPVPNAYISNLFLDMFKLSYKYDLSTYSSYSVENLI